MDLPEHTGIAICIQNMVFGNSVFRSGTGVCLSRNPETGAKELYGEFVLNAQGEDVVSGSRISIPVKQLEEQEPDIFKDLTTIMGVLEKQYRDMQDVEFTVDGGNLFVLQSRRGQRNAHASVRIAVEMVEEGLVTEREALLRIDAEKMDYFLHAEQATPKNEGAHILLGRGLPASAGIAVGKLAFESSLCEKWTAEGQKVILCLRTMSTEDLTGIKAAIGLIMLSGTLTSEAAILCRGLGKVCVTGATDFDLIHVSGSLSLHCVSGEVLQSGDTVILDGSR